MSRPTPPRAQKLSHPVSLHGRERDDPYAWLRDENWQNVLRDPALIRDDIRAHLVAENAYVQAIMSGSETLQSVLFEEMKGRIKEDDSSVPAPDGVWDYYLRFETGAQHPIHARRPRGAEGREQVLIDADAMARASKAAGHAFFKVGAGEHSPDHTLYAYSVDEQGSEVWSVRVRDLATGADLPSPVADCYGDFSFSPDSRFLFWVWRDDNGRPAKVYRRPARGGAEDDVLVYEEPDDGFFLHIGVTENRGHLLIVAGSHETNETWTIPAADPTAAPKLFAAREDAVLYSVTHWNGRWTILTNADGAVDFKIMVCGEDDTARSAWRDFIAHTPGRYIEQTLAFRDHLVRLERVDALPQVVLRDRAGEERRIAQDEEAYALSLEGGFEYDTTLVRYRYNSPTTPPQWFDYDMATGAKTLRKTQEIPSGHDPAQYRTRRLNAVAPDGALVPITLIMRADLEPNGAAPCLLYGYGAYGISQEATFSIRALSLVNRGWVFAQAHTRGGADKGYGWYVDGKREKKPNTFTDFIACAEHLIGAGYAKAGRIVAYGGSAGGMLMGAAANLRPDLWAGIVAAVPFVDVLNTMSDATLPLTPPEWPEWGNPLESAADYDMIAAYSPYDKVSAQPYPAILATGGLADPRVTYWEPAKWAAKLREMTTSDRPIGLKINLDSGHAGAAGRFDYLKEIALDYAFAIKSIGDAEAGGQF
jgi:oligopeptidase B